MSSGAGEVLVDDRREDDGDMYACRVAKDRPDSEGEDGTGLRGEEGTELSGELGSLSSVRKSMVKGRLDAIAVLSTRKGRDERACYARFGEELSRACPLRDSRSEGLQRKQHNRDR
jgi:hypothetical protein